MITWLWYIRCLIGVYYSPSLVEAVVLVPEDDVGSFVFDVAINIKSLTVVGIQEMLTLVSEVLPPS